MTRHDRLALSLVVEPGDTRLRDLLADHEPAAVLRAVLGGRSPSHQRIPDAWRERAVDLDRRVESALGRASAVGLRWVCRDDPGWPPALDDLDHVDPLNGTAGAPLGLWVRGSADLGAVCTRSVAVVGARGCTTYGAEVASDIGADLADAGWTVVSGAAFGIDGCAHRGALSLARPTVAVLACGADVDYPRAHASLLERIAEDGLVVSEQAPGATPTKGRFLTRNRIIAALAAGTVVVEAELRSGSLNTLGWADQLGRTTMAVPGPVTSSLSGGTHAAVREGKAVLVTSGTDVLGEVGPPGEARTEPRPPATEFDRLPPAVRATLDALAWDRPVAVGELAASSRLGVREVRVALRLLERRGLATHKGSDWVLTRRADTG